MMILNLTDLSAEPIHSQISRQMRSRILAGSLEEGVILPRSRVFARRHRVSAISVERAFGDLSAEGLVVSLGDGEFQVATVAAERRRDMAQQRLLETLREQEFSTKELELARDIQCRLLPPPYLEGRGWAVVARNEPARFVAGDFYDVLRHGSGQVDLVVADVAGKGIGPSLIMASVKAVLPFLTEGQEVQEIFGELNRRLCRELGRREFIALSMARFTPETGQVELANAGLPDPYLLRAGEREPEVLEVPGERLPLGLRSQVKYDSRQVVLEPGDRLLLLSDGLPEAETEDGEPLGYERLKRRMATVRADDAGSWLDNFLDHLREVTAHVQRDDWTAMLLERRR